ncbi:protein delta homolog 2-like isoform X2 [Heterodontus francisci]|uniref:protein delta homolog 2-like isoform X2 n=1 Tax=Heterodontus francisci TaxID=7792 RepID=UPI00355BF9C9
MMELFWDFYTGGTRCVSSPCKNNATCVDDYGKTACKCLGGFDGTFCETDINECELMHPCPPGTTCVDGINKFTCNCPADGCNVEILTNMTELQLAFNLN